MRGRIRPRYLRFHSKTSSKQSFFTFPLDAIHTRPSLPSSKELVRGQQILHPIMRSAHIIVFFFHRRKRDNFICRPRMEKPRAIIFPRNAIVLVCVNDMKPCSADLPLNLFAKFPYLIVNHIRLQKPLAPNICGSNIDKQRQRSKNHKQITFHLTKSSIGTSTKPCPHISNENP